MFVRFFSLSLLGFFLCLSGLEGSPEGDSFQVLLKPPKVSTITFEETIELCGSEALILLSDGSQWIIQTGVNNEVWDRGDQVIIKTADHDSAFDYTLKNLRTKTKHEAELDPDHLGRPLTYHIETIDRNGYAIFANQGMLFTIGWLYSFGSVGWNPGDSVIIADSGDGEYFLLINYRDGSYARGTLASWRPRCRH